MEKYIPYALGAAALYWFFKPSEAPAAPAPAAAPAPEPTERPRVGLRKIFQRVREEIQDVFDGDDGEVAAAPTGPVNRDGVAAAGVGALRGGRIRRRGAPAPSPGALRGGVRPFQPRAPLPGPMLPPNMAAPQFRPPAPMGTRPPLVAPMPYPVPYPMPVMPVMPNTVPLSDYTDYDGDGDYGDEGDATSSPAVAAANQFSYFMSRAGGAQPGEIEILGNGTVSVVTFPAAEEKRLRNKQQNATGAAKQNGDLGAALVKRPGRVGMAFTNKFERAEDLLAEEGWEELFPTHLWAGGPL